MRRPLRTLLVVCLLLLAVVPVPSRRAREAPVHVDTVDVIPVSQLDAPALRDVDAWYTFAASQPPPAPPPHPEGNLRAQAKQEAQTRRVVYGTGACGGDLPPCSVLECESGGNLVAKNPHSSASGKWQILDTTWRTEDTDGDRKADSYRGYSRAMDAPESVQDDRAREIWAGGAGRGQWVCN